VGWICFILLILWGIWKILTSLPRIIGFALKVPAGLLVLYVCGEAFVFIGDGLNLISAEVAFGYSFVRSNRWSILWISAGIIGVCIVICIWTAKHERT
jgi:hypothetical protein